MTPDVEALKEQDYETNELLFFAVSLRKLLIMTIFTSTWFIGVFSLYEAYWFFAHISHVKKAQKNTHIDVKNLPYLVGWLIFYALCFTATFIFSIVSGLLFNWMIIMLLFDSFSYFLLFLFICALRLFALTRIQKRINQSYPLAKLDAILSIFDKTLIFISIGLVACTVGYFIFLYWFILSLN